MSINVFRNRLYREGERGDTIVEVLISVAIASLILAGGYAITNRNLLTSQDTQEHNQAMQIAQQQVEGLRALSSSVTLATEVPANDCVTPSGTPALTVGSPCKIAADGSACAEAACYTIKINKLSNGIYEVSVTWEGLNKSTSSVALDYGI